MAVLAQLEPKAVFHYFEEICAIPHESSDTQAISDYLVAFAKERNLYVRQDTLGNVIIKKPATSGYEDAPVVMLQGHMDMVCEKTDDKEIDFHTQGLDLVLEGNVIHADRTTLGGDDGIAVALLGLNTPIGVFLSAFLFGFMKVGGEFMQAMTAVPKELIDIIISTIIYFSAIALLIQSFFKKVAPKRKDGGVK